MNEKIALRIRSTAQSYTHKIIVPFSLHTIRVGQTDYTEWLLDELQTHKWIRHNTQLIRSTFASMLRIYRRFFDGIRWHCIASYLHNAIQWSPEKQPRLCINTSSSILCSPPLWLWRRCLFTSQSLSVSGKTKSDIIISGKFSTIASSTW